MLHHAALILTGIWFLELSIFTLCFTITVFTPEEQRSACWAAAQTHPKCNVLTPWVQSLSNRRVSQSVLLTRFHKGGTKQVWTCLAWRQKRVFLQSSLGFLVKMCLLRFPACINPGTLKYCSHICLNLWLWTFFFCQDNLCSTQMYTEQTACLLHRCAFLGHNEKLLWKQGSFISQQNEAITCE